MVYFFPAHLFAVSSADTHEDAAKDAAATLRTATSPASWRPLAARTRSINPSTQIEDDDPRAASEAHRVLDALQYRTCTIHQGVGIADIFCPRAENRGSTPELFPAIRAINAPISPRLAGL